MRRAGEHGALVSDATELSREVEGQALYARVEAREELVRDEKNADLRRPSSFHPSPASGTAPYIVGGGSTSPNGARRSPHVSAGGRS